MIPRKIQLTISKMISPLVRRLFLFALFIGIVFWVFSIFNAPFSYHRLVSLTLRLMVFTISSRRQLTSELNRLIAVDRLY